MSDEIVEAIKRAGSDGGRPLGFGADDVVRVGRIRRRRRRVYAGSASALGVAIVAILAMTLLPRSGTGEGLGEPATVPLDRGPMSEAEAQAALNCIPDAEQLRTIFARQVDSMWGTVPAVLATVRRPDGKVYSCGTHWAFRGTGSLMRMPDHAHPIVSLTIEPGVASIEGAWGAQSGFFRVTDSVARVETRVGTPGGAEPWRVSTPYDGVVYWSAWLEEGAGYDADDEVWLRWRAFDTAGHRIDPALMPFQPELIDPTGDNEVAAEYDGISELISQVALDRLQTERGSVEGGSVRHGSRDDSGWSSVTSELHWSPWHRTATAAVEVSLNRSGTLTDAQLLARIGCQRQYECQKVEIGDQGSAWVGENDAGSFGVGHVQPDGEIAYIVIDTEDPYLVESDVAIDITVDEAIDFVTDERLDLPTP
jgi:hypothetical protein